MRAPWWSAVLVATLLGAGIGSAVAGTGSVRYKAEAKVVVQAKGFDSPNPEELVVQGGVAAGKTVVLQASPATLVVKVVDGSVGPPALPEPVGGATVRVLPASGPEQTAKTKEKSDKNAGEARFEKLPAGSASIRVQADGFAQVAGKDTEREVEASADPPQWPAQQVWVAAASRSRSGAAAGRASPWLS